MRTKADVAPTSEFMTPRLVSDNHRGADGDAIVQVGDVFIGHADAAGGHRMADGFRLVRAMNAIERRAQIHGAGAERVLDAARQVTRQIRPSRQHLRGRGPARPFLFGGDAMGAAPAKTLAADTDAVSEGLAVGENQIKSPLAGADDDGAGRITAGEAHKLPRDRAGVAEAASKQTAHVEALGSRGVDGQHGHRRQQQRKSPGHFLPRE
jgi:hypothetical protein